MNNPLLSFITKLYNLIRFIFYNVQIKTSKIFIFLNINAS